jgi:selenium metabolism protein YedF
MSESIRRIDAKGLPCPQPLILAKKALEEGGFELLEIVVDNDSARENVSRFAEHEGHSVEAVETVAGVTTIRIRRGDRAAAPGVAAGAALSPGKATATVFIASAAIGSGNEELGALLIKGFLSTLLETSPLPERIIFMNGGVKLATEGSASLDKLALLAERGVEILSCGTCLDFYKLKDKLAVGRVSNMFEIAGFLMQGSVLSL